ncbi:MAG: hypothetical protein UY50_C0016G0002 [Parcubacteria group bacterium GW2011_GWA2_49_9]|nr:MAG: hypothetical protein UY50_C0016G0002 [Parcubacteria group bacterium GW2011_GWA2_49_9]
MLRLYERMLRAFDDMQFLVTRKGIKEQFLVS